MFNVTSSFENAISGVFGISLGFIFYPDTPFSYIPYREIHF